MLQDPLSTPTPPPVTPTQVAQAAAVLSGPLQTLEGDLSTEKPPTVVLWGLVALVVVAVLAGAGYLLVEAVNGNQFARESIVPVALFVAGVLSPSPMAALRGASK